MILNEISLVVATQTIKMGQEFIKWEHYKSKILLTAQNKSIYVPINCINRKI